MSRAVGRDTPGRERPVALSLMRMAGALLEAAGEPAAAIKLRSLASALDDEFSSKLRQAVWRVVHEDERRALARTKACAGDT